MTQKAQAQNGGPEKGAYWERIIINLLQLCGFSVVYPVTICVAKLLVMRFFCLTILGASRMNG